jgi:competence protein ComEA
MHAAMTRARRMFRRDDETPAEPATGPGSVSGRRASGIILTSGAEDWVPPGVPARPQAPEPGVAGAPEDWLPPKMPERTSAPPTAERRRSTVNQVPAEMATAAAPGETPDARVRERELQETLERVTRELDAALRETERLREQIAAMQAPPAVPRDEPPQPAEQLPPGPESPAGTVNLNTASIDELVTLPGVGRRAAERLVEYREARGPLRSVSALLAVEGFNTDRIARLRGRATV